MRKAFPSQTDRVILATLIFQYLFCWFIIAGLLILTGIVGCFIPVIPGPIVAYAGLSVMRLGGEKPSMSLLVVFAVMTVAVTVLDYVVPAIGAKRFNCSRAGTWGGLIGTIVGMFFFPVGLLAGPFCGAFLGELMAGRKVKDAAKGGLGAFLGFLSGVLIKLLACLFMLVVYIFSLW